MTDESPQDVDYDKLAAIAADPAADPEERRRALEGLTPLLLDIIEKVARQFDNPVQQALLDDGLGWFVTTHRIARFRSGPNANLRGWLTRVFYHRAIDLRRQWLREQRLRQSGDPPVDPAVFAQRLQERADQMRQLLDRWRWPPADEIDFYALFLARLRLCWAAQIGKLWPQPPDDPAQHVAAYVVRLCPWHEDESLLRFRSDCPPLGAWWNDLVPLVDRPGSWVRGWEVCERLNRVLPPERAVTLWLWNQWMRRALQTAQEHLPAGAWKTLFAPLVARRRQSRREDQP